MYREHKVAATGTVDTRQGPKQWTRARHRQNVDSCGFSCLYEVHDGRLSLRKREGGRGRGSLFKMETSSSRERNAGARRNSSARLISTPLIVAVVLRGALLAELGHGKTDPSRSGSAGSRWA